MAGDAVFLRPITPADLARERAELQRAMWRDGAVLDDDRRAMVRAITRWMDAMKEMAGER